jgi:hypothetical protein
MILGIDFDNTIVCYDRLFHRVATEQKLISADVPATKEQVRDHLRACGQEKIWTELQGYVYAERIVEADAFPGVVNFFQRCREMQVPVYIVSHKTRHPYEGPKYDLHAGARAWLRAAGFFDPERVGLDAGNISFEPTKQRKLERIAELGCTAFVDDLPEFLEEPNFPTRTTKVLFDPWARHTRASHLTICASWDTIGERLLGKAIVTA